MDRSLAMALVFLTLTGGKLICLAVLGWVIMRNETNKPLRPPPPGDGGSRYRPDKGPKGSWPRGDASHERREALKTNKV